MVRDAERHRGRLPQAFVRAAQIVVRDVQRTAAAWLSSFFEKPLPSRANRLLSCARSGAAFDVWCEIQRDASHYLTFNRK